MKAFLFHRPAMPKRPDIGIRRIVPPSVTEPPVGRIKHRIGGKTGKQHCMTIDDTVGGVNMVERGCVKLPLWSESGNVQEFTVARALVIIPR